MEELTLRFIATYNYLKEKKSFENDTDFAQKLEVSRSMVTEILKGRTNPGVKILQNTVSKFGVDGNWLFTGDGEMMKKDAITPTQNNRVDRHNLPAITNTPHTEKGRSDTHKAKTAPPTAPPTQNFSPKVVTMADSQTDNIAFVPVRAQAGYLNGYADPEYFNRLQTFRLPGLRNGVFRAFEVRGDSMAPTVKNREVVIAEYVYSFTEIVNNQPYIIVTKNDGVVLKRVINSINQYGYLLAKSDANDQTNDYPDFEIYPEEIVEIWRAVAHISRSFDEPTDTQKRLNDLEVSVHELIKRIK